MAEVGFGSVRSFGVGEMVRATRRPALRRTRRAAL